MSGQENNNEQENEMQDQKLIGVIAQYDDPDSLLEACEQARDAGFKKMDAYTPFPVHGIEKAIGIPRTILPFIVLAVGLGACGVGLGLQWFTNGTENIGPWSGYQFKISGKPFFSLPANIPVTFEIIVLSSAFAAFLGMLILNQLPRFANPLHRVPRFRRATNDRFFLGIAAADSNFDLERTKNDLNQWGATEVEEVYEDMQDQSLPSFVKTACVLLAVLLMIPPVLTYRARGMTARETRMHVVPDMDFQIKYKPQQMGPVVNDEGEREYMFSHLRAARKPIPGTVARGQLVGDEEYFRGYTNGASEPTAKTGGMAVLASASQQAEDEPEVVEPEWVTEFPSQIDVNEVTIKRGQRMFDIYCSVCHGYAGDGDGLVSQRASALSLQGKAAWTQAKSLYDPEVVKQPIGRIYDTITNGRATMGPYATRISPNDRWAIVLYIKTLHESRRDVPFDAGDGAAANSGD